MSDLITALPEAPVAGPASTDREAWLELRRGGITATEVRDLVNGGAGDRRRIMLEKVTGEAPDLSGNRYIEHGRRREPLIAAWVEQSFGITPNEHVYARGRYLATPDGVADVISEIKTSKHDLDPDGPHFARTGYADQMQWQMFVMGVQECLFVWEQHDDAWPDPAPLGEVPRYAWFAYDPARVEFLRAEADRFLLEVDAARSTGLAPVGDIDAEDADLVHRLLMARNAEAVAKAQKEQVWRQLQERLLADGQPDLAQRNDEATLTVSTTTRHTTVTEVDAAAMLEHHPAVVAAVQKAEAAVARAEGQLAKAQSAYAAAAADHSSTAELVESSRKLTVTAVKPKTTR